MASYIPSGDVDILELIPLKKYKKLVDEIEKIEFKSLTELKEKVDKSFIAFCHVKLVQHTQDNVKQFEREVIAIDEVLECYHLSGDYDYLLKVHVKDMESYRKFMIEKLTNLNHIGSTHSMFMINEVKHTTALNI